MDGKDPLLEARRKQIKEVHRKAKKKPKWLQFGQSNTGVELVLLPRVATETKIWHLMKLLAMFGGKEIQPNKRTS